MISSTALLFSATFRKKIERLARDILVDPIRVVQGDIGEVRIHYDLKCVQEEMLPGFMFCLLSSLTRPMKM